MRPEESSSILKTSDPDDCGKFGENKNSHCKVQAENVIMEMRHQGISGPVPVLMRCGCRKKSSKGEGL